MKETIDPATSVSFCILSSRHRNSLIMDTLIDDSKNNVNI